MNFSVWFMLILYPSTVHLQKTTVWKDTYTYKVAPTTCQCQGWHDFWQFWIGDPSQVVSITLGGSLTSSTYKCSGLAAQFVATALALPSSNLSSENQQVTCDSGSWFVGYLTSVSVNASTYTCDSTTPMMRPCWYNWDFGGIGSANCAGPTQTFTVTVVTTLWTDSFTQNGLTTSETQCSKWRNFWQKSVPQGQSLSISFRSSINGGVSSPTCSGNGVNLMARSFYNITSQGQVYCNEGSVWYFTGGFGIASNWSGVQMGGPNACFTTQLALRPCWLSGHWGGFGGVSCSAPSQTFTANVSIGAKTVFTSSNCLKPLSLSLSTGSYTISCNTTTLQCNSGYFASGFSTALGVYSCSSATGIWVPKTPDCILITTTTTTTTTTTSTTTTSTSTTTKPTTTTATLTSTTTIPTSSTSAPATTTSTSTSTTTAPNSSTTIPTSATTIPTSTATAPTFTTSINPPTTTALASTTSIPTDTLTAATSTTTKPTTTTATFTSTTTIPTSSTSAPATTTSTSTSTTTAPTSTTTVPTSATTIPTSTATAPTFTTSINPPTTTALASTTSIPTDTLTAATSTTTIPTSTATAPTSITATPTPTAPYHTYPICIIYRNTHSHYNLYHNCNSHLPTNKLVLVVAFCSWCTPDVNRYRKCSHLRMQIL